MTVEAEDQPKLWDSDFPSSSIFDELTRGDRVNGHARVWVIPGDAGERRLDSAAGVT